MNCITFSHMKLLVLRSLFDMVEVLLNVLSFLYVMTKFRIYP